MKKTGTHYTCTCVLLVPFEPYHSCSFQLKTFRFQLLNAMPFALKNPYADAVAKGEKRPGESIEDPSTPKKAKKAPSAASLVMMENVSKPNRLQRLPATGPLNVCIYKVTDRAGDVWSNFEGTTASLWQARSPYLVLAYVGIYV